MIIEAENLNIESNIVIGNIEIKEMSP